MASRNILYYSPRCKYSHEFVQQLKLRAPDVARSLIYVNIDAERPRHPITQVPSLIFNNQIYSGKAAFQLITGANAERGGKKQPSAKRSEPAEADVDFAPTYACSYSSPSPNLVYTDFQNDKPTMMQRQDAFSNF